MLFMKRSFLVSVGFALLVVLSFAFTNNAPRYKNLKVLPKSTTKEQMDSVMKHFTAALGVKCNYCHQFNPEQKAMDFASDANEHKGIARKMMKLTQKVNKKYFDVKDSDELTTRLEVTCYTCHNGKARAASFPVASANTGHTAGDSTRRQQ